jgi:hypothetical protein
MRLGHCDASHQVCTWKLPSVTATAHSQRSRPAMAQETGPENPLVDGQTSGAERRGSDPLKPTTSVASPTDPLLNVGEAAAQPAYERDGRRLMPRSRCKSPGPHPPGKHFGTTSPLVSGMITASRSGMSDQLGPRVGGLVADRNRSPARRCGGGRQPARRPRGRWSRAAARCRSASWRRQV